MSEETTVDSTPATTDTPAEAAPAADPRSDRDYINTPRAAQALRALMAQEKSAREAREDAEKQQAAVQQSQALQQLAQADPVAFLERSGIRREDVSKRLEESSDPVSGIRDDVAHLRRELAQQREMAERAQMEAAMAEAREQVRAYIAESTDAPLTRATGSAEQVWQLMTQHHQRTGDILSEQDATQQVERHLAGQIDRLLDGETTRALVEEKLKARGAVLPQQAPSPRHSSTLTNEMQTAENQRIKTDPNMNRESSLAEAAQLLKWGNKV